MTDDSERIQALREQIFKLGVELRELEKRRHGEAVPDYNFVDLEGEVSLRELFAGRDKLIAIRPAWYCCRRMTRRHSAALPIPEAGDFGSLLTAAETTFASKRCSVVRTTCPAWWPMSCAME